MRVEVTGRESSRPLYFVQPGIRGMAAEHGASSEAGENLLRERRLFYSQPDFDRQYLRRPPESATTFRRTVGIAMRRAGRQLRRVYCREVPDHRTSGLPLAEQSSSEAEGESQGPDSADKREVSRRGCSFLSSFFLGIFPFINIMRSYDLRSGLPSDIICGFTVGIMNIPQGMAYAMLATLPPVYGLYCSLFAPLFYFFFGTSRHLAMGTIAIVSLLVGGSLDRTIASLHTQKNTSVAAVNTTWNSLTVEDETAIRIALGSAIGMAVGLIQLSFSILRLGFVTRFLSDPMISGFTVGSAVHVVVSQLKTVFGLSIARQSGIFHVPLEFYEICQKLPLTNFASRWINPMVMKKAKVPIPMELVVVVLGGIISYFMQLETKHGLKVVGVVPSGLPVPRVPDLSMTVSLVADVIVIALVVFSISYSLAAVYAKKLGYEVEANQELMAYGMTSILSSFFLCFPPAGSLSRSALTASMNGQSEVAGLVGAAVVLLVVLFAGPLFYPVPNVCLLPALFYLFACACVSRRLIGYPVSDSVRDVNGGFIADNSAAKVERWRGGTLSTISTSIPNLPRPCSPLLRSFFPLPPMHCHATHPPPPSEGEVADAIRKLRNNKAPGEDGMPAEVYKSCVGTLAPWLHEMIEGAWRDEVVPDDWGLGILVPILKKGDKTRCENYHGISLIDVAAKIFAIVILRRFQAVRDSRTRPNQAGFRAGRGCADQIFTLRRILEFLHSHQQPTVVCIIDFATAFDSLHRESLWRIMALDGVPTKIMAMIKAYYRSTSASVLLRNNLSQPFGIRSGVRQGCILSPILFNCATDWILWRALRESDGVEFAPGHRLTELDYADDVALLASSFGDLQSMVSRVNEVAISVGLSINAGKAKVFSSCIHDQEKAPLEVDVCQLEDVDSFKYLRARRMPNGQSKADIVSRIDAARWVLSNLRKCLWIRSDLSITTKIRMYRASVRPVLLYGYECWASRVEDERKMEVFDHHCMRTILRVKFTNFVSNEKVCARCDNIARITQAIQERRLRWFGHVLRRPPQELSVTALDPAPLPNWRRRRGCCLSAIILVALIGMFTQMKCLPRLWRFSIWDFLSWTLTFIATIFLDVIYGLIVGILFSAFSVLHRAQTQRVQVLGHFAGTEVFSSSANYKVCEESNSIKVIRYHGDIFYACGEHFVQSIISAAGFDPRLVRFHKEKLEKGIALLDRQIDFPPEDEGDVGRVIAINDAVDSWALVGGDASHELPQANHFSVGQNGDVAVATPLPAVDAKSSASISKQSGNSSGCKCISLCSRHNHPPVDRLLEKRTSLQGHLDALTAAVPLTHIILDCAPWNFVDIVGLELLQGLIKDFNAIGVLVYLAGVTESVRQSMEQGDFFKTIEASTLFISVFDAFMSIRVTNPSLSKCLSAQSPTARVLLPSENAELSTVVVP
ncbi:hypothetical protein SprV_0100451800 [Sparganum proliferum]